MAKKVLFLALFSKMAKNNHNNLEKSDILKIWQAGSKYQYFLTKTTLGGTSLTSERISKTIFNVILI